MRLLFISLAISSLCGQSICLNMIVKDEEPVIERCLNSLKDLIDYWVIVDTGSSDRTKDVIYQVMKDIPGQLFERPWVNFGHNRQEALKLAEGKGDYLLFIDADETLSVDNRAAFKELALDGYLARGKSADGNPDFQRLLLVKGGDRWRWDGVIHEQLKYLGADLKYDVLPGVKILADKKDGHRSKDPNKYLKDAKLLEKAVQDDPENADYTFYLAQSYAQAGELELSRDAYLKRSKMGGWDECVFWSLFIAANQSEMLSYPEDYVTSAYLAAYDNRPTRAEPLICLADYLLRKGKAHVAYMFALIGSRMEKPTDRGYVLNSIYAYQAALVLAKCALATGRKEEAISLCQQLLLQKDLPSEVRTSVKEALAS